MDMKIKDKFIELNKKYFNNAELPITFYYSDTGEQAELVRPGSVSRCVIGALAEVRKGRSFWVLVLSTFSPVVFRAGWKANDIRSPRNW